MEEQYPLWVRNDLPRPGYLRRLRHEAAVLGYRPLVSVLLPLRDPDPARLARAMESVSRQVYSGWELRVRIEETVSPRARETLDRHVALEDRIATVPDTGEVLSACGGEFVMLLGQDDAMAPDALFEVVRLLQDRPGADLVYADSDEIDDAGDRSAPRFKPGWSPELLLSTNYLSRPCFFRKEKLEEVGGLRGVLDESADYDLALRFTEKTEKILRVPKVLYHSRPVGGRSDGPDQDENSLRALSEALERRGGGGTVERGPIPGAFRVRPDVGGRPKVSLVIPTRDNLQLLENCLKSVEEISTYGDYEVLVVDNNSAEEETLRYLRRTPHRVLRFAGKFNYSRINNYGVAHATGEYVLLLNDDTEVISPGWMEAMLEQASRPGVGAVGAKLLYPDGLIQHAGVVLGAGNFWAPGVAAHSCQHYPTDAPSPVAEAVNTIRNYSAVTAACMMLRKEVFDEVGGFDEDLTVAFNDVDLCLRIRETGRRIVYTPHAELYHYESSSRGFQRRPEENLLVRRRWGATLDDDPYYNPNYSLGAGDFNLRADALRPRILREDAGGRDGPSAHLEEMEEAERLSFLKEERKRARDSRRTAVVKKKERKLWVADLLGYGRAGGDEVHDAAGGGPQQRTSPAPREGQDGKISPAQLIWMFGSPRTGSTWLSGMMAELENQRRWNEPYVGLLFGSFLYERTAANKDLTKRPEFIMGEPYRRVWLNGIRGFVTGGAAARYPDLGAGEYLVVKEPNGSVGAPLLMEALPESRMIFLLRDPRDVVASLLDAHGEGGWNKVRTDGGAEDLDARTRSMAARYARIVSRVQEAFEAHDGRKTLVRYEDLRTDTLSTMRRMYAELGVEVDEARLASSVEKHGWERIPQANKGAGKFYRKASPGGWEEDLTTGQVRIVEEVTAPFLSRYY